MVFIKLDSSKELSSKSTTHTTGMPPSKRKKTFLSTLSIAKRQEYPTVHSSDESLEPCTSRTVATKRRSETFQAAVEIHGACPSTNNLLPAQIGLLDTVEKKC